MSVKNIEFIPATAADRDYLLHLRLSTMVEHLEKSGQFLSVQEHEKRLNHKYDCSYIVELDKKRVGTVKFENNANTLTIYQIQISPGFQQQGIGSHIINKFKSMAGSKVLALTVLKDNPALKLYQRHQFNIVGEDDFEFHMEFIAPKQG